MKEIMSRLLWRKDMDYPKRKAHLVVNNAITVCGRPVPQIYEYWQERDKIKLSEACGDCCSELFMTIDKLDD